MCAPKQSEKVIFLTPGEAKYKRTFMYGRFFSRVCGYKKGEKKQLSGGQWGQEYEKAYKMHLITCENIP